MIVDANELRSRLQTAMEAAGVDATSLAKRIGRSPEYVRDFLNGRKNSMKATELTLIELALEIPQYHLTRSDLGSQLETSRSASRATGGESRANGSSVDRDALARSGQMVYSNDQMPILSAREEDNDVMVVITQPFDFVPRPWFLKEARECFGVIVPLYIYDPVFQINDIALVNPRLPIVKGKNSIITSGNEPGSYRAQLVELCDWTRSAWMVRRYNDHREEEISREVWQSAFPVVARVEG